MTQPAKFETAVTLASSIPEGAASLESILYREELQQRTSRPPDYGPCGDVLDRNCTVLFRRFERRCPYLLPVQAAMAL
jgi:hypothetical protein